MRVGNEMNRLAIAGIEYNDYMMCLDRQSRGVSGYESEYRIDPEAVVYTCPCSIVWTCSELESAPDVPVNV